MGIFDRSWQLRDEEQNLGMEEAEFTLERRLHDGLVYFAMKDLVCANETLETWTSCRLVQHGQFVHAWDLDPPLNTGEDANTRAARINNWVGRATAATLRLEGEVEIMAPTGTAVTPNTLVTTQAVTVFVAQDAVQESGGSLRDLIILKAHGRITGTILGGGTIADGTITGDPRPHP